MPIRTDLIVLAALVGIAVWLIAIFNRCIALRNKVSEAWSGIDVQLKRRHDLVPALVETVRGYRDHETQTLTKVIESRNAAAQARNASTAGPAEAGLSTQLRSLFAIAEAYPELKADQSFRQLGTQLVEIEDQLQYARRYHNGAVRDFNNLIQSFPINLIAGLLQFREASFFEVDSTSERTTPNLQLG